MARYACEHAYFAETKTGRQFILCAKTPAPDMNDAKAIIHAMCPYQKPCKQKVNCGLIDGWGGCFKLRELHAAAKNAAAEETAPTEKKPKARKKKAE